MPIPDEISNMYVGTQSVANVYLGDEHIWPTAFTYQIVVNTIAIHYYRGLTEGGHGVISAIGGNNDYAYVTGDVDRYRGGVYYDTIHGVTLTPSVPLASHFSISGTHITASNLATTPVTVSEYFAAVTVSYGGDTQSPVGLYVYQQSNTSTGGGQPVDNNFSLTVAQGWTQNAPAAASAQSSAVTVTYTRNYTWTSGATSTESTPVAATLYVRGAGLSAYGSTISWASRGETIGNARSATVSARTSYSSGDQGTTLVYQEANTLIDAWVDAMTFSLSNTSYDAAGNSRTLTASITEMREYDSGIYTHQHDTADLWSSVSVSSADNWLSKDQVGSTYYIVGAQNQSASVRTGVVSLSYSNDYITASNSINVTQAAAVIANLNVVLTPVLAHFTDSHVFYKVLATCPDGTITALSNAEVDLTFGSDTDGGTIDSIALGVQTSEQSLYSIWQHWALWNSATGVFTADNQDGVSFSVPISTIDPIAAMLEAAASTIGASGGTIALTVKSGYAWTLSADNGASVSSGSGNAGYYTVTLTIPANSAYSSRTITATLTANGVTYTKSVEQAAASLAYHVDDHTEDGEITAVPAMSGTLNPGESVIVTVENGGLFTRTFTIGGYSYTLAPGAEATRAFSFAEVVTLGGVIDIYETS